MRYRIILFIVCLSFTFPLAAQQFSLGVRAGYSLSDEIYYGQFPDNISRPDYALLTGYHVGLDGRLQLNAGFALLAGLQYAQKGYTGRLYWPTGPADARYMLHYATVPVIADFNVWKGLSLQTGLEAGWLQKSRVKSAGESFDPEILADVYNDFDLGVVAGLEYRFGKSFFVSARHVFGVTPRSTFELTNENGERLKDLRVYNSSTQFSVGYQFNFAGKD